MDAQWGQDGYEGLWFDPGGGRADHGRQGAYYRDSYWPEQDQTPWQQGRVAKEPRL